MKKIEIAPGFEVSCLSYGCMRTTGEWDPAKITTKQWEEAKEALTAAYESGYTFFDHADIYAAGECERVFGEWLREHPGVREELQICTKVGILFDEPHRYDFSRKHIEESCDKSLKRLGIDCIDIYLLHRPDYLMDPEEVAAAFDSLYNAGKVRHFGVSNFKPSKVLALQRYVDDNLVTNQVEFSLGHLDPLDDGTLDQAVELGMSIMAWSPLAGGGLKKDPLTAIRWLLKHPSKMIPVVGSRQPERIRELAKADEVEMSREDWYRLLVEARGKGLP